MNARSLWGHRRGATSILFAGMAIFLFSLVGVVIDLGNVLTAHRALQGANDLVAIAAASDLANATAAAQANAVANQFPASDVQSVTLGIYTANPSLAPSARFSPAAQAQANAVQVTMTHKQPLYFIERIWTQDGSTVPITTQAIATQNRVASYELGSGVASWNNGIANAMLGAMIGGNVSLSAIDYQSLASAQVDLFGLANAIAVQLGQPNDSYAQAFGTTVSESTFLNALASVTPSVATQLQTLANAASSTSTVNLSQLAEFGPYANLSAGGTEPSVTATASALSLVQAAAQLGGTSHLISLSVGSSIPGITSVTGMMTVVSPPVGTTLVAVDQAGSTLHTSQVRLYLNITLGNTVQGAAVQLPLYLEVGYATASLASMSCTPLDGSSTQVTLNVTPGLVNGWIGNVTAANMTNTSVEPTPTAATLLNLVNIATVTGRANAQIGNVTPVQVSFSQSDIQNDVIKQTSTTDFVGSLLTSLIGNLSMQVNVLGLPLLVPSGLTSSVSAALTAAVSPVDQLITATLQAAGLGLGNAYTTVTGARCSAATLSG